MEPSRAEPSLHLVSDTASTPYRTVPANEEAEMALLGAVLINNEALDRVSDFLKPEQFYYPAHGRIFAACLRLREQLRVADPVTLKAYFEQDGDLQSIGGAQYLADLAGAIVSVQNIDDYAQTIFDLHLRRQLIAIGEETVNDSYKHDLEVSAADQIRNAEEKLYTLANEGDFRKDYEAFGAILDRALESAGQALNRDTSLTGATTGLIDMDRMLGGLQNSDLVILAARPSMGKTALATNMAFNAARAYAETDGKEGAVVAFFSLEMSSEQLAVRILSDEAKIASEKIRKGEMKRSDFPRLVEAAQTLRRVPIFVDDTAGLTITALRTRAMRLKRQHNLGMIVVDYLQLMRPSGTGRSDNRVQEISEITRGLKMIAKDLNVPVLALSQLSRAVEQREDKRPQLADLRESGSIEQDADVVMFIYREAYYVSKREPNMDTPEHAEWQADMERVHNMAEVIIGKQRHGPTGTVRLHFEGMFTRFSNLDTAHHFDD
ncbi:replicative DNA helicase [Inquilinus sp. CAU 1745]|uniref:replicative DNA helicase n=1 Tax=Inquilinus sp. CAU 1745 TaxID=3140369 RepID=UPI00325A693B